MKTTNIGQKCPFYLEGNMNTLKTVTLDSETYYNFIANYANHPEVLAILEERKIIDKENRKLYHNMINTVSMIGREAYSTIMRSSIEQVKQLAQSVNDFNANVKRDLIKDIENREFVKNEGDITTYVPFIKNLMDQVADLIKSLENGELKTTKRIYNENYEREIEELSTKVHKLMDENELLKKQIKKSKKWWRFWP